MSGGSSKMMAALALAALLLRQAVAMDNGLARTPPMGWFEACPPPCPGLTPHTPLAAAASLSALAAALQVQLERVRREPVAGEDGHHRRSHRRHRSARPRLRQPVRLPAPPLAADPLTPDGGWRPAAALQGYRWRVGELQPRGSERDGLPHAARRLGLPQPDLLLPLPGAQAWHVCVSRPLRRPPL